MYDINEIIIRLAIFDDLRPEVQQAALFEARMALHELHKLRQRNNEKAEDHSAHPA